ncbi:hypothetical protein HDU93_000235 [Gonapodya sp. JEL0774]|nr:hypothetical protein HDU93_000235 [Gonapodya sp. JEL0774]
MSKSSTMWVYPVNVPIQLFAPSIQSAGIYRKNKDTLEYWVTEHLRLSGVYWGLTALAIMGRQKELDRDEVITFVKKCWHRSGGFGGSPDHDPHILYTLSALQVLAILDALDAVDRSAVMKYILTLSNPDGSFRGDAWGEVDSRFAYCALQCATLIEAGDKRYGKGVWMGDGSVPLDIITDAKEDRVGRDDESGAESAIASQTSHTSIPSVPSPSTASPDPPPNPLSTPPPTSHLTYLDTNRIASWIARCRNFDGGFGNVPGAESHAGHIFTCVAALAICGRLDLVDRDLLGWWLAERQLGNGGLNGRPEKLEDDLTGGFSDRPPDAPDVFHTLFAIAALSMLGYAGLQAVDPVYCLPAVCVKNFGLEVDWG